MPINYAHLFEDLLRKEDIEDRYINPYIKTVELLEEGCKLPSFRFKLEDLGDDQLFILMKKNIDNFLDYFREALLKIVNFHQEIKDFIEENNFEHKELNIILDDENFDIKIPELTDFSKAWSRYLRKLIKIKACYMTLGLDKNEYSKRITYFCEYHSRNVVKDYPYGIKISMWEKPNGCFADCKNRKMRNIDEDDYTIGTFTICERDFKARQEFRTCYIFRDIDYFIEKIDAVHLGDDVEILGILRKDPTKLGQRDEIADYYIDVIDIKILKEQRIDEKIIKTLQEKIKSNPSYVEMLIDSIHPLTFLVDIFFPIKFLIALSFITGGSWRKNKKDTLNSLIVGTKESFKSSIERAFIRKVGNRHMFRQEVGNKGLTLAGLFGTTERNPRQITPDVRYGVQTLYSDGTTCYDEIQKLASDILEDLVRYSENGVYMINQDGIKVPCPNKSSLILSQNLMMNDEDGSLNEEFDLATNLGWNKKNIGSLLDRIDTVYVCPQQDTFIEVIINKNETREHYDKIDEQISKILELNDYEFPKLIVTLNEKLDYIHYNFFHNAKRIYRSSSHSKEVIDALDDFYNQMLRAKENYYVRDHSFGIRGKNTVKRMLRGLSSLWFKEEVSMEEFSYFTDNCLKLILRFRTSKFINMGTPDKNKIFKEVFKFEIIDQNIQKIDLKELINHLKAYLKRNYYEDLSIEEFEKRMIKYLGSGYNKANYILRKLLLNNKIWLEMQGYNVLSKPGKGNLTTIEKAIDEELIEESENIPEETRISFEMCDILNLLEYSKFKEAQEQKDVVKIYELIKRVFSENDTSLKYDGLIQTLNVLAHPFSDSLLNRILIYFVEIGFLVKNRQGFCRLKN